MRGRISAVLVSLMMLSQLMTGCKSATEPEWSDDSFSRWVGTWVGADAAHQISLQIRRGASYQRCDIFSGCRDYADIYSSATFSDAVTGLSGSATSVIGTADRYGQSDELEFDLLIKEVTGTPGVALVVYTYRGRLQGDGSVTGTIVLARIAEVARYNLPISADTFAMTLHKR